MPTVGQATLTHAGERLELSTFPLDHERAPLELEGVTFLEALLELRTSVAARFLPDDLDVSIPGTVRVSIWQWYADGDLSPASYLAEVRLGCHRTTVRYSFPVATVFSGPEADRKRLVRAGFPCERGEVALSVFNDVTIGRITSARVGVVDVKIRHRDEIAPENLQWNLAAMLNVFPHAGASVFGVALARHQFDRLKRGKSEIQASGTLTELLGNGKVGQSISGLSASGRIRLEIPRPLHTDVAANR
jgi:hypothetical protein